MDIHGSWIWHRNIFSIFTKWIIRHGYRMDTSTRVSRQTYKLKVFQRRCGFDILVIASYNLHKPLKLHKTESLNATHTALGEVFFLYSESKRKFRKVSFR